MQQCEVNMMMIIMAYLVQVWWQAVVEVLHGHLLVVDHCSLPVRGQRPGGGEGWLGDAGPVTSRAPVHAGRAPLQGPGGDEGLAASDQLHPLAQADSAATGDAVGAVAALAADRDRHGEMRWDDGGELTWRWWAELESLRGVLLPVTSGHL